MGLPLEAPTTFPSATKHFKQRPPRRSRPPTQAQVLVTTMGKVRACDVCSIRKVRCNGVDPCLPCTKASFDCSFTKSRLKPGPKGPHASTCRKFRSRMQGSRDRKDIISSTEELDSSAFTLLNGFVTGTAESSSQSRDFLPEIDTSNNFSLSLDEHDSTEVPPAPMSVSFSDICSYLEIYQCKMYPVWPAVERTKLITKLADNREDHETCALATAVCAATGAQLKLDKDML
jgi:hypothetical protein